MTQARGDVGSALEIVRDKTNINRACGANRLGTAHDETMMMKCEVVC